MRLRCARDFSALYVFCVILIVVSFLPNPSYGLCGIWKSINASGSFSVDCRKVKPPKRSVTAGCFEGHEGPIRCIHLWKEKHLLTGSEDGTVRQFKLKVRIKKIN